MEQSTFEKWQQENSKVEIAKKRDRILAFIVDFVIYWGIGMILGMFFGEPAEEGIGFHMTGLPAFGFMLFGFFIWPISEGIWGQTIGKRVLNLKVTTIDHKPIGMGQAFGRFFLGYIDCFFLIGIMIAANNKLNQRIGDLAASTIVVKEVK